MGFDPFTVLLGEAYDAGQKAASTDYRWDGRTYSDPLGGGTPSGWDKESVLEDFNVQTQAAVTEYVASGLARGGYDAEVSNTEEALLDSWENGYADYEEDDVS